MATERELIGKNLSEFVADIPPTGIRYDNDCAVIAMATMVGYQLRARGDYRSCAQHLIEKGIFDPESGSITKKFFDEMRVLFRTPTRFARRKGETVEEFLSARPNWTGLLVGRKGTDSHVMPVINGKAYNTGHGDFLDAECRCSLIIRIKHFD